MNSEDRELVKELISKLDDINGSLNRLEGTIEEIGINLREDLKKTK